MTNIYKLNKVKKELENILVGAIQDRDVLLIKDTSMALREVEKAYENMFYQKNTTLYADVFESGDLVAVLKLAKQLGFKFKDMAQACNVYPQNITAYMKGKTTMIGAEKQSRLFSHAKQLILGGK